MLKHSRLNKIGTDFKRRKKRIIPLCALFLMWCEQKTPDSFLRIDTLEPTDLVQVVPGNGMAVNVALPPNPTDNILAIDTANPLTHSSVTGATATVISPLS